MTKTTRLLFLFVALGLVVSAVQSANADPPPVQNDMSIVVTPAPAPQVDLASQQGAIDFVNWLVKAAKSHDYITVIGLMLALTVAGLRWGLPRLHDKAGVFFNTEHGKGLLVLICAELAALSTEALAHQLGVQTVLDGMVVAFFTAGGYSIVKPLFQKIFGGPPAAPPAVKPDIAPKAPIAPAAIVLVFAATFLASVPSCGPVAKQNAVNFGANFANCGIGKLPQTVQNVEPVVQDALQHDPAWQGALTGLGLEVGTDVVTCAVYAAVATWQQSAQHAALSPDAQRGLRCGQQWLAEHGVK